MNKFSKAIELLKNHYIDNIHINLSPVYGYRSRVEFGYKNNFYTMFDENGNIKFISILRIARPSIQLLMPELLKKINSNKLLNTKLFQINFMHSSCFSKIRDFFCSRVNKFSRPYILF